MEFLSQKIQIGVMLDNVTVIMGLMVTMCAMLIHLFSVEYMEGEIRYNRFFAYIGLFTGAMLALVYSDNLLTFFMSWELMGLCSYLLIGFYFEKPSAANASLKAFMTTRVGDTVMFLGMVGIYQLIGSLRFDDIYAAIHAGTFQNAQFFGISAATFIGFCIFCGTVGKSAQFPLQVWLPDAMEGPTPVSALIHAATMVSAGVFLIVRMFPMLDVGNVLPLVAFIGGFTALFAAILAIVQTDIKKVLAYSTLSQLGYMVLAVGVGSYVYAFFHLITHACFKACLFMGSGSVIKAMHHEQDMKEMGGLSRKLPVTMATMAIATCAISGVPFFSGFISKDGILASALGYGFFAGHEFHGFSAFVYRVWAPLTGFGAAALTAFYMWRMMFMTFFGKPRNNEKFNHAHENNWPILVPLITLAVCSVGGVFANSITGLDGFLPEGWNWFLRLVVPAKLGMYAEGTEHMEEAHHHAHTMAAMISIVIAAAGISMSAAVYLMGVISPDKLKRLWPSPILKAIYNLYYFDFFYINVLIKKILLPWNAFLAFFDRVVVDQLVDFTAIVTHGLDRLTGRFDDVFVDQVLVDGMGGGVAYSLGDKLRTLQVGYVQVYFLVAIAAIGVPLFYFLMWR
jgi:NADH-quinone oxidoreductase subunit L